jgi:hypothetical protein
VAATIINANPYRRRGAPLVQPSDFFVERPTEDQYMSIDEARKYLDEWAAAATADARERGKDSA